MNFNLKEGINTLKSFAKKADQAIQEELNGNETYEKLKEKVSEVKEKYDETIRKFNTEHIEAEDKGSHLLILLVIPGISKQDIGIDLDETKQVLTLDLNSKNVSKNVKSYWSVDKSKLIFDYKVYGETIIIDEIKFTLTDGVLNITIPKKEIPTQPKKSFTIN